MKGNNKTKNFCEGILNKGASLWLLKIAINVILSKIDHKHVFDLTISVDNKILQYIVNSCILEISEIKSGIQQGRGIYKNKDID
jgi:hypothetical protein